MVQIRLGIAGLGTVGVSVFKILGSEFKSSFKVTAVSARDKSKNRVLDMSGVTWVDNPVDLVLRDDVDVVVEVLGGDGDPAYSLIKKALQNKKPVVTANKALLAHHGHELTRIAKENNVGLYFEAAVAGGIPIIKLLSESLSANKISSISGVLNGTCNYILTTMERTGRNFRDVLTEAQTLGYAEADPTLDIDGGDTAHKLSILSALAFGGAPDLQSISITGIRDIAADDISKATRDGCVIKLLAQAHKDQDGRVIQTVSPCRLPLTSPFAKLDGVLNGVLVEADLVGQIFISGRGAGAEPTASAVVADLLDIARNR